MNSKTKKYIKILGNFLVIIALILLIQKMINSSFDYQTLFDEQNIGIFIIVICIQTAVVFASCIPWWILVGAITRQKFSFLELAIVFGKANIMKYIPGNVFQYIGRNELAIKKDLNHMDVAVATVIDTLLSLCSGVLFSIPLLVHDIWDKLQFDSSILFVIIVLCCIAFFVFNGLKKLGLWNIAKLKMKKYRYLCSKTFAISILKAQAYYVFQNALGGMLLIFLLIYAFQISLELYDAVMLICGLLFSTLVGMVTPGAPGGIGIRETVMLFIAGNLVDSDILIMAMIILRIASMLGDLITFFIVMMYEKIFQIYNNHGGN